MKIVNKKTSKFTVIPNELILDPELTPTAKWVLFYILSRPVDWQIYSKEITKHSKISYNTVRRAMNELIQYKYVERIRVRHPSGKFAGYLYWAYEKPIESSSLTEAQKTTCGYLVTTKKDITKEGQIEHFDRISDYHRIESESHSRMLKDDVIKAGYGWTEDMKEH